MAKYLYRGSSNSTTAAGFTSWAGLINPFMIAAGWVQTTDTGQVNWSSLVLPGPNGYVYEIFKSNDVLSSTFPIYVKFEYYGPYNSSYYNGTVYLTVGTGTNGAGTLTGSTGRMVPVATANVNSALAASNNLDDLMFYGSSGSNFSMLLWRTNSTGITQPVYFSVERSKDNNGNDTASYALVVAAGYGSTYQYTVWAPGIGYVYGSEPNGNWIILLSRNTTTGYGSNVGLSPIYPWVGKADNPGINTVQGWNGDFTEGAIAQLSLYGTTHSYFMTAGGGMQGIARQFLNTTGAAMIGMRWE
jgi:hypothetical protein